MQLNLKMANELIDLFGGDAETDMTLTYSKEGHSGEGIYAHISEYPEEGSYYLGVTESEKEILEYRKSKAESEGVK